MDMKVAKKAREGLLGFKERFGRNRGSRFPKAFPSDTYVADLYKASKTGKTWGAWLSLVIAISVVADFYLLQDSFALMLNTTSATDLFVSDWDLGLSERVESVCTVIVCAAFVVAYLTFGSVAGKKLAEYRAYHNRSALVAFIVLMVVELAALAFIALVRYESVLERVMEKAESGSFGNAAGFAASGGFGSERSGVTTTASDLAALDLSFNSEAFIQTVGLISVMLLGALAGMIHSYYTFDPFAGEKKRLAESHIAEDKRLYESVYAQYAADPAKNMEYEKKERALDRRAVDCAFRISELSAQLNGIVDPADAYDFCTVSRLIGDSDSNEEMWRKR